MNPKDVVLVKEACRKWPGLTLNQIIFKHAPPSSIQSEVLLVYSVGVGVGARLFQACSCQGVHCKQDDKKGKEKALCKQTDLQTDIFLFSNGGVRDGSQSLKYAV